MPTFTADHRESKPTRVVARQRFALESLGEELLTPVESDLVARPWGQRCRVSTVETELGPGLGPHLDDERAPLVTVGVGMGPHHPCRRVHEHEVELVEHLRGTEPDVSVPALLQGRPQPITQLAADRAVRPVGTDHQVGSREVVETSDFGGEPQVDAQVVGATGQDLEQGPPGECRKAVATGHDLGSVGMTNPDVAPVSEDVAQRIERRSIGLPEPIQCLVAEHHTEAEGVPGAVSLEDGHRGGGVGLLDEDGEIQAGRPSTRYDDPQ